MKRRIQNIFLVIVTISLLLVGCKKNIGTPEDNAVQTPAEEELNEEDQLVQGKTFGYSCAHTTDPYFDIMKRSVEIALQEQEYHLISKDPGMDSDLQIQQIQELVDLGVSAVILCPADREQITPALEVLEKADIPVINVNTPVKEERQVNAYVGIDNKQAGYLCGEELVRVRTKGGTVVILESPSINSINERITGFEEAISKAEAGFEVLARSDVQGEKDRAKSEMEKLLKQYKQIDAVMCGNDQAALGAVEAIEATNRSDVLVYSVDGAPGVKKKLADKESVMAGTTAISPIGIGRKAVEAGIAILEDKEYQEKVTVDMYFMNKESVEMFGTDGWQ